MQSLLKFTAITRIEVGPRKLLAVSGYLRFPSPRASWWSPAHQGRWEPPQAWEAVFFLKSQWMQSSPSELDGRELKRNCYTIRPRFSAYSPISQENRKDLLQCPILRYLTPLTLLSFQSPSIFFLPCPFPLTLLGQQWGAGQCGVVGRASRWHCWHCKALQGVGWTDMSCGQALGCVLLLCTAQVSARAAVRVLVVCTRLG